MVSKVPENGIARPLPLSPGTGTAAKADRPQSLMELLTLPLGRTPQTATTARVENAAPVSEAQRQQLISRLLDTLLQWQSRRDSPQKQRQLAQLTEERALLNSPLLKLVRLSVRHSSQKSSMVTYTDRPLTAGQNVAVYQSENRLWQLAQVSNTDTTDARRLSPAAREALADTLRRVMPLKDQPDLAPQLPRLQQLTFMQQRELLSPTVQQALRQVARQLRHPVELSQPQALKQALTNSGNQLEQKLFKAAADLLAPRTAPSAPEARPETAQAVAKLAASDWKGALLRLLQTTRSELSRLGQTPELQRPADLNLATLIQQLAPRPAPELAERSIRSQLLQMVHQLTLHSLARVQFQQSQSVAQAFAPAEAGQPAQTWTMELPLRLGQEVHPLMLRIAADTEGDDGEKRSGKVRQWQVQLSFELPEAGLFHAQITVRQQQVATRLWAEQPDTAKAIRARLGELRQRLEKDDIEVTQLECHAGAPPRPATDIHYSLVDITT